MKILKFVRSRITNHADSFVKSRFKKRCLVYQTNFKFSQPIRPDRLNENNEIPREDIPKKNSSEIGRQQEEYDSDSEDQTSFKASRTKLLFTIVASSLGMFGIYQALNYLKPEKSDAKKKKVGEVTYVGKPEIGGTWKLLDTDGKWVTHKNFEGKYYLIYFGFTQCPDVCPMSLQKIAKMLKKIRSSQEYKYYDIECFFVSVDPDRDTLERIKQYCEIFDNQIKGLTHLSNDHPDFKEIMKKFKIHSSKIYLSKEDIEQDKKDMEKNAPKVIDSMDKLAPKNNLKYSMDHTIVTYLFSPNNTFLTYLSANLNAEEMYNIVTDEIMNDLTKQLKKLPSVKKE
jgi:cytochrome oxidase Cu insertion factor (SCO1/SenC/PrrC family)